MATPRTSIRAAYAKHILHEHLLKKYNHHNHKTHDHLPRAPDIPDKAKNEDPYTGRICIVGAGAAGLYTAMMLKYLGITNIDIFEASSRVGGRCYTQPLSQDDQYHNYYDVGAMRIPEIQWMNHVLAFIDYLELDREPYIYKNDKTPCSYWYRHNPIIDNQFDTFMQSIVKQFTNNFDSAFSQWLATDKDNWSTKEFLMSGPQSAGAPSPPFTYDQVATAEIYDTSTGLFDQSFTETVIDYADLANASTGKWWRVEGGIQKITDKMQSLLASTNWPQPNSAVVNVTMSSPVVAMSNDEVNKKISVTVKGQNPVNYDMVFNTTAMSPLQHMDLQGLGLPDQILTGIRTLSYDRATKVAIRFTKPWWNPVPEAIYGGISTSDLPISNIVYPSWNDGPNNPAVLMVSYSWAQDATRMASLVSNANAAPSKDDPIVTLCLQNLVKLWSGQPNPPSFNDLSDMYMTHHAWAWSHDPWTGGAFALFGPGQYKNVYLEFIGQLLCDNKLALCGEALSAHHAWISGALDSAYLRMSQFLLANGRAQDLDTLKKSIFGGGPGKHVEEMDEELMKWTVLLGEGGGPDGWGDEFKSGKGKARS